MLDDLLADLASKEIRVRVGAVAYLAEQPDTARPQLAALVANPRAPSIARVWASIALCHVKDDAGGSAVRALTLALNAPEAAVRSSALGALGALRFEANAAAIAMNSVALRKRRNVPTSVTMVTAVSFATPLSA